MYQNKLWAADSFPLAPQDYATLLQQWRPSLVEQLAQQQLPTTSQDRYLETLLPLAAWINQRRPTEGPLLIGINGSQGSGKTTLCSLLKWLLEHAFACRTVVISIDDLYLPRAARQRLAQQIHPLLATRGVPGTHDIPLGLETFARLKSAAGGTKIAIPAFSKADDDRLPEDQWPRIDGPVDLVLFEGWCVGATPEADAKLSVPVNRLEAEEDADGNWRRYVNTQLAGPYQSLFAQLDLLLMLRIPDWELVYRWRSRQEAQLSSRRKGVGVMNETQLRRFIQHYERLTRHQLAKLPNLADLTLELDSQQQVCRILSGDASHF